MCEGGHPQRRSPGGFFKIALQPGRALPERLREIGVNLGRRLRDGRLNDCCGNYGDPGC